MSNILFSVVHAIHTIHCPLSRLVVYGVYNLTTRAIFNTRYPVSLLLQDLAWGTLFNTVYLTIYMVLWRKLTDPVDL